MPIVAAGLHPTRLIVLLSALVAFGPLSIDMYLPSLPAIARDLAAPVGLVQFTIGGFLTGFCLGMLLYGPLSDRFGRRPVLLAGIALYLVASLACAFASSAEQLIALRVLQAVGGGAGSVMGRTVVRDVFPLDRAAQVLSLMHLVTMIAPLVAPVLGGWLLLAAGWRSLFLALALFGAVCLALVALRLPETHPAERRGEVSLASAFSAYGHLLTDTPTLGYMLALGLTFGAMFAYITGSPFVYIDYFGVAPQHYGWLFGLNIASVIVLTTLNKWLVKRVALDTLLQAQTAVIAAAGLALWLAGAHSLLAVVLPLLVSVGLTGSIGPNTMARLLQRHSERAGAAMALAVSGQFGLGMLASALVAALHDGTPRAMCQVVALFGVAACLGLQLIRLPAATARPQSSTL
ncbi:Bcr/CflA family multidrug efflux MFS transporter [Pseudogulbenkiania ferrooxidans]|uniref:Bcr/CflA family efflux transporter n=1 Tax=Pseudogulbenkiania ferrooxidans 2002 TaxID=279714 RepID=B9Z3Z9_9NEIS|nr:Bcr/CflA family multidrug efflux MFS transporter [Pseudogulbenkiania ferrooxidans]EEG08576.1 drug resistance transporter, Bcr/CflA subfamily [Pseudogulbenkiania ferrooxidans 2002]